MGVIYVEGAEEVPEKTINISKSVLAEHGSRAYKFVETNDCGRLTNEFEKALEIDNLEEMVL